MEKITENHSTVFSKNFWQFPDNQEKSVEKHDCVHPEGNTVLKKKLLIQI